MGTDYPIIIIGSGVIGLAIAHSLGEQGYHHILIIDKGDHFGQETSSRNSEVIHSGIYYPYDSLKAQLCTEGRDLLYDYCQLNHIWFSKCGKLVIGQLGQESQLRDLYQNGIKNQVPELKMISQSHIQEFEPHISAKEALFVGCTGILDSHALMQSLKLSSENSGHDYLFQHEVIQAESNKNGYTLHIQNTRNKQETVSAKCIINASGLSSDLIARLLPNISEKIPPSLKYSKGEYFKLSSKWRNKFSHLIYPIPDKRHDSLGIHLSFDAIGNTKLGPNAHWMKNRELNYVVDETHLDEFYSEGKSYIPDLKIEDLTPDFSGIRPKLKLPNGTFHDFYIEEESENGYIGWINLIGMDSPGLTSSLAIGKKVTQLVKSSTINTLN